MSVAEQLDDRRAPIDAERLIQWALAPGRAGGLRWRGDIRLAFDEGLTAKPRRKPRGSWALIEAGAASATRAAGHPSLDATADPDAGLVHATIGALPEPARSLVLLHGRRATRPCWLERRMSFAARLSSSGRPWIDYADRRHHRWPYCALEVAVEKVPTERSRADYAAWHAGVTEIWARVTMRLDRWYVVGFAANPEPWRDR